MGLSILYFFLVCVLTILAVALTISAVKPAKPRLRGLSIFGLAVVYAAASIFLVDLWGDLMNKWYGQWPAFVFGIIFGIPALVVTAGAALGILVLALYAVVRGRFPARLEAASLRSVWNRLGIGLAAVFVLVVVGGCVVGFVLRNH
jgi:hypothetical protein